MNSHVKSLCILGTDNMHHYFSMVISTVVKALN